MAITKSAKKALRQSKRKKVVNDRRRRAVRETTRDARKLVSAGAGGDTTEALSKAYKAIDKAAKGRVINKSTAARRKSKIARMLARP